MKYVSSAIKGIAIASIAMIIYSTYYKFWFDIDEVFLIFVLSSIQAILSRITRINFRFPRFTLFVNKCGDKLYHSVFCLYGNGRYIYNY